MLVAVLASRLLGLVREMLIARQFGQTGAVSAYTAAFNIPDLLYFFLSSGALSSAFIPEFTKRFETGKKKEAWEVYSIIACFMGLVLTAAIAISWIYAKPLVSILAVPGFVENHPELVPLTMLLTRIILPCQLFFFLGGLMSATLESRQNFKAKAAGPVIYNIGIIFGAVVLSKWFHIAGLAIGTLIGAFIGNIVYTYYLMKKDGFHFYPSLNLRHPGVIRVATLALPVIFGLGLPQIDVIVNKWFASFVSAEAPAALNYANRLMQVPLGIFAQAAGTAILPMLSAYAAKNAIADMRSGVAYGLRAIMVESLPATVFMIIMADPLIRMIYMGGEFRPSSVGMTAMLLIWYSVGIFAWAGQRIVAPGFFAMQDTITPVVIGTISTIIFLPLNFILMRVMGVSGIALSTTIAISLHFLGMTWFLKKRLHGLEGRKILSTVGRTMIAAAVMGVVCYGVRVEMSNLVGTWQLQDGDFRRPMALAAALKKSDTPLSSYIYVRLTDTTRQSIDDCQNIDIKVSPAKALIKDLNKLIAGPSLYNEKFFTKNVPHKSVLASIVDSIKSMFRHHPPSTKIKINDEIRKLISHDPKGKELAHLNRLLLATAYPIHISDSGADTNWLLDNKDIDDYQKLALQLANIEKPFSHFIMTHLSTETRGLIAPQTMPYSLMHDMNQLANSDNLYTSSLIAGIKLPAKVKALADKNPTGKQMVKQNRLLLEAVYPREIVKRPVDRVEGKMGSALTVLLAMGLGGIVYFIFLKLLKVDEMDYLWHALRRKFSRKPGKQSEPPVQQVDIEP